MPDNTTRSKRLHLERYVAHHEGYDYAREFIDRVIEGHRENDQIVMQIQRRIILTLTLVICIMIGLAVLIIHWPLV